MSVTKRTTKIDELPSRLLADEEAAWHDFSDHFGPRFRIMFIRRGLTPFEAEDLAVACIEGILSRLKQYRPLPGKPFEAWVFRIARNKLADWQKEALKRKNAINQWQSQASAPLTDSPPRARVVSAVQEALASLPEKDREIVFDRDMGVCYSYKEIAARLHTTVGAARVRHKRAIERLKSQLQTDHRIKDILERCSPRRQDAAPVTETYTFQRAGQ